MTEVEEAPAGELDEVLASDNVADLVEYLVVSLVDKPEAIAIDLIDGEASTLVEVHVDPEDIGKVIGRHGRVIKSIRTLARACAARDGITADVEVIG
jgi:hypothetical protein